MRQHLDWLMSRLRFKDQTASSRVVLLDHLSPSSLLEPNSAVFMRVVVHMSRGSAVH